LLKLILMVHFKQQTIYVTTDLVKTEPAWGGLPLLFVPVLMRISHNNSQFEQDFDITVAAQKELMVMDTKKIGILWLAMLVCFCFSGKVLGQDDVANIPSESLTVDGDKNMHYFLIGADESKPVPKDGFNLVIVLPGGTGGADFNPFVKRIYKNALSEKYLVAQLVSVKWTSKQRVIWPTKEAKVEGQKFSTEKFVEAVVKDIKAKYKVNERNIFTLSWSSGGPAAYAISLQKEKSVTGSYIAMSVFKPDTLPTLEQAEGHAYFIDHSPDDKICPFRMAENAHQILAEHGAKTRLVTYKGGHGWQGDIYGRIRKGIQWLQLAVRAQQQAKKSDKSRPSRKRPSNKIPFLEGFETGGRAPIGWRRGANIKGVEYIWDKNMAFKGKASLCLAKMAKRFFPIAQWSKTFAHDGKSRQLQICAGVKARQTAKSVIDVQFISANGKNLGHKWAAYISAKQSGDPPADHDWKEYKGTISIPDGTERIMFALQIYGPGTVWFDELSVDYTKSQNSK